MRAVVAVLASFTAYTYQEWSQDLALRPHPSSPDCPSHYPRPVPGQKVYSRWGSPKTTTEEVSFSKGSKIKVQMTKGASKGHFWRAPRKQKHRKTSPLSAVHAGRLHMDHLPLSFTDYLWCNFFILPPSILHFIIGGRKTTGLLGIFCDRLRQKLGIFYKIPDETEASNMVANLLLECISLAVWCKSITVGRATFSIPNSSRIIPNKDEVISGTLVIMVNLKERKMVEATHGTGEGATFLGSHDALALLFIALVGNVHPLVHSYANWGVNLNENINWFIRRMGVITVKYNNIGVETYPLVVKLFKAVGITSYTSKNLSRLTQFMNHNVPNHNFQTCRGFALQNLKAHSEAVSFLFKVRKFFLSALERYKEDFPAIDNEALFIGTVMHSLDHRNCSHYLDSRVFTNSHPGKDPSFEVDHEFASITLSCAVDQPPGRLFSCSFRHAPHPFYQEVYEFAKGVNPRLAGYMEACIGM